VVHCPFIHVSSVLPAFRPTEPHRYRGGVAVVIVTSVQQRARSCRMGKTCLADPTWSVSPGGTLGLSAEVMPLLWFLPLEATLAAVTSAPLSEGLPYPVFVGLHRTFLTTCSSEGSRKSSLLLSHCKLHFRFFIFWHVLVTNTTAADLYIPISDFNPAFLLELLYDDV
jgi:hypothetical protein